MTNNLKSIINEILEDIDNVKPNTLRISFDESLDHVQIEFDGYNYSSYFVNSEEYEIIKNELNKLVLK